METKPTIIFLAAEHDESISLKKKKDYISIF